MVRDATVQTVMDEEDQPWRRSRPDSLEVHEVGDVEAVTHILWISTC